VNYIEEIYNILREIEPNGALAAFCAPVLDDERFNSWPAAVSKHHAYRGGLKQHTYEVLRFALDSAASMPNVDRSVIAVSAVWHDVGKFEDYDVKFVEDGEFITNIAYKPFAEQIGHLPHSYALFCQHYDDWVTSVRLRGCSGLGPYNTGWADKVKHCIIAHHGRKEWGSPREPSTLEALLIHQADMSSVMYNCGVNPQHRDKKPDAKKWGSDNIYRGDDFAPGDILTIQPHGMRSPYQASFLRLDRNGCPIVRGLLGSQAEVKVPLRFIVNIAPPYLDGREEREGKTLC